jgi:hypothetical protein
MLGHGFGDVGMSVNPKRHRRERKTAVCSPADLQEACV